MGNKFTEKINMSSYSRNILKLMTGTTLAQAIPVAISPIITRLYTPEEFGVLALFISITSIMATIATVRYELAVVLPDKPKDSIHLVALSFLVGLSISIFTLVIILIFHDILVSWLGNPGIGPWLYWIPLAVFLVALFNVLSYFNIYCKSFGTIAKAHVYKSSVLAVVQLTGGFLKAGAAGLVSGQLLSYVFGNIGMSKNFLRQKEMVMQIRWKRICQVAKRYIDFVRFSLWASLATVLSNNLTEVFISTTFQAATLGFYGLIKRVLAVPQTVIGQAVSQVYYREAAEKRNEQGNARDVFIKTVSRVALITFLPFLFIYLFPEKIFSFVFGNEWVIAGKYAKILVPFFFVKMIVVPVTITNSAFEQQKKSFILRIGMLALVLAVFAITILFKWSVITFFRVFSYAMALYYLFFLWILYRIACGKYEKQSR